ncbi:MAG: Ig-like domain-containing protein [Candidatus Zixiibacteriota bacterium]
MPLNAVFTDNGNGTGSFVFDPDYTQAGVYNVRFIASDGSLADSELVAITVNEVNLAPVLTPIGPRSVTEGQLLSFVASASDPDGTTPAMSAEGLPVNATFNDNGNGTATFSFSPTYRQAGVYVVTFIAGDGSLADSELVTITVVEAGNQPPVLDPIGAQSVIEGDTLLFRVHATDVDSDSLHLFTSLLPPNALFVDSGNGAGSFRFLPDFTQAGTDYVTFAAEDTSGGIDNELVRITVVSAGNQRPILAPIGAKSVAEAGHLAFRVSATDADMTIPALTAVNLPAHAVFVDSLNGAGSLVFDPDYTQAGVHDVTVIASDGSLADSEVVAITVTNVNRAPVLAAIGSQSVNEGQNLTFGVMASDPDLDSVILTVEDVPVNAVFTDNGNGSGSFVFDPDYTQSGVHNVRFIASDGTLADSELVMITVNHVNRAPVLAAIGPQSVNEGQNLTSGVSAADPDADSVILTAENVPVNAVFTDNGNGTGSFVFDPDYTQAGVYNVRFIASDGALADSEVVAITVTNVNRTPALNAVGPESVNEGQNLTFGVSGSDPDLDSLILTAENVPANAVFTDNGNGTGSFVFDPDFTQAGIYNVRFIASDGSLADSEVVAITVTNVNRTPVLNAIGPQSVNEGQNLTFGVSASDPDGNFPALTAENAPLHATFTDNGNGTGSFVFSPDYTQSGTYDVRFIASDGALADSELVTITVNHVNLAPILDPIGPRSVFEGDTLKFRVHATDADLDSIRLFTSILPTNAAFVDSGNGAGSFVFTPSFTQSGTYYITFAAQDPSAATDNELVTITVSEKGNQAPVLAPIGPKSVAEGAHLTFGVSATDPDADSVILTAESVPLNATFTDNGNGTGSFVFDPDYTQAGVYNVRFIASDGALADSEIVAITVSDVNRVPVLASIGPKSVNEGQNLTFGVSATDPDADSVILTAENVPLHATFTDNGNGTGSFVFDPDFTQSGVYNVRFIASDGALADSEIVAITVGGVNLPPVLASIGPKSVNEGQNLTFGISGSDPDLDSVILTAENVPLHATFTDNGNGTGSFVFDPDFTQSGVYNVRFIASDGALADSEIVAITVGGVNLPPVLASIGPKSVNEGQNLTFGISGSDPDLDSVILTAENVPLHATFTDNGNGTGSFVFDPDYTQAGVYNVRFIARDVGLLADSETVAITVTNVNRTPVLAAIGPKSVNEGQNLTFGVSATDPDADSVILTAENVPINATFTDNGNGTGSFVFDPDYTQAGVYNVRFIASDGSLADSEIVAITVNDINAAPALAPIGAQSVAENSHLEFRVTATDIDGTIPVLNAVNAPANAVFTDSANGAGSFVFDPDFNQTGVYNVTFIASDGALADSEIVAITVTNSNRAPVADAGPDQGPVAIGSIVTLDGGGSYDPDAEPVYYHWRQVSGPAVTLSDSNAVAPTFVPAIGGTYAFSLRVDDAQLLSDPDTVQIVAVSQPRAIADLMATVSGNAIQLTWSAVTLDTSGAATSLSRYVIYRSTRAYFTPTPAESIGTALPAAVMFTDNNVGGADVVGDTGTNYFYCLVAVDVAGGRSTASNRVGEYDYQIFTTSTTDFTLIMMPFAGTGINTASDLIQAIGVANVNTVNRYVAASQSFESRFAAGFGTDFAVVPGGIYQVNAKLPTVFSIAGQVPAPGSVTYPIVTTSTTDYSFIGVPFERELDFTTAQSIIDALPGVLNTLNRFIPTSQSYESRFAAGFGPNFPVKAGRAYQANAANPGQFPAP